SAHHSRHIRSTVAALMGHLLPRRGGRPNLLVCEFLAITASFEAMEIICGYFHFQSCTLNFRALRATAWLIAVAELVHSGGIRCRIVCWRAHWYSTVVPLQSASCLSSSPCAKPSLSLSL